MRLMAHSNALECGPQSGGLRQPPGLAVRIATLLLLLTASAAVFAAETCPVAEQELTGAWSRRGDSGFFEEFRLEKDASERMFHSWLHHNPELFGAAWRLENCRLIVEPQRGELPPFKFKVLGIRRGKLYLYDESQSIKSVYVRIGESP